MPRAKISQWSNPSVLEFANGKDPIVMMEKRVRSLVLEAMEKGWSGPPFDPIKLAELMKIRVSPSGDVSDARTLPKGRKAFQIEYNPNRSRGRIRFSVAHEIAHTLFADCYAEVRNRHSPDLSNDDWQLETLCNIGASEIVMPIGTNLDLLGENFSIHEILKLRREFDVSTEALLIRLSKLASRPLAVFCASRLETKPQENKFRIDYSIESDTWPHQKLSGSVFRSDLLSECTAIGYTVLGSESLPKMNRTLELECVGLPPYPSKKFPRIAGIVKVPSQKPYGRPRIHFHEGDATRPGGTGSKIITHIVNDRTPNWGGGGFAVALKKRYPVSQEQFREWVSYDRSNLSLGRAHFTVLDEKDKLYSYSMVAQHGYGSSAAPRVRYRALESCLLDLRLQAERLGASIHMPRIGIGNAGGQWSVIEEIIHDTLVSKEINVNIYDFVPLAEQPSLNM